jgi:hypothetical protein
MFEKHLERVIGQGLIDATQGGRAKDDPSALVAGPAKRLQRYRHTAHDATRLTGHRSRTRATTVVIGSGGVAGTSTMIGVAIPAQAQPGGRSVGLQPRARHPWQAVTEIHGRERTA